MRSFSKKVRPLFPMRGDRLGQAGKNSYSKAKKMNGGQWGKKAHFCCVNTYTIAAVAFLVDRG
jgi:hypothetical protein